MTRVVVTLTDSPENARNIMNSVQEAGFDGSDIESIESDPEKQSFFKRVFSGDDREEMKADRAKNFMTGLGIPEDNAEDYAEQVEKGRSLVLVRCESESEAQRANDVIRRAAQGGETETEAGRRPGSETGGETEGEQRVQAAEEELHVGKKTETGGVRVSKETTEQEVEEDVTLRKEDVDVERKDVDRPLGEGEKAFEDEEIEVSETREEPVVEKQTKVREEVTVSKDVEEQPETIRETVRREHIDVENMAERAEPRYEQFEPELQSHYEEHYADEDRDFGDYSRGYRYGMALAEDEGYRGRSFEEVEPEAGRHWETQEDTTWDEIKDAVRYGWNRIRGRGDERRTRR